jgi:hypothetical protein
LLTWWYETGISSVENRIWLPWGVVCRVLVRDLIAAKEGFDVICVPSDLENGCAISDCTLVMGKGEVHRNRLTGIGFLWWRSGELLD